MTLEEWLSDLVNNFLELFGVTSQEGAWILFGLVLICVVWAVVLIGLLAFLRPKQFSQGCSTMFASLSGGVMAAIAFIVLSFICSGLALLTVLVLLSRIPVP